MPDDRPTSELPAVARRLVRAREAIAGRDPREIAELIAATAAAWLAPDSVWMQRAIADLSSAGVWSRQMLEVGLPRMIEPLSGVALEALVERELGGWGAIERAQTPRLMLHVLPSNLPGHAAIPSALSLLLRAAAIIKPGRDDRTFPGLWVESLQSLDPGLAACVAPVYWRGGDRVSEDLAMSQVDLVVASGSDASVDELRRRCQVPFVAHGERISCAIVGREALGSDGAAALAADVAIWDQLGCLSPQVCFVEGDVETTRRFGEETCAQLAALERRLPPGKMSVGEMLEERRFRDEAAWRGFANGEKDLFAVSDRPGSGSVAVETRAALRPTPLHRCIRIAAIGNVGDVAPILAPHLDRVEAVGIASGPGRFAEIAARIGEVPRIVPLGEMQKPDLTWRPGGRPRIAEWQRLAEQARAESVVG